MIRVLYKFPTGDSRESKLEMLPLKGEIVFDEYNKIFIVINRNFFPLGTTNHADAIGVEIELGHI